MPWALYGLGWLTDQSCVMVAPQREASVLKSFTAITSCMCSAPTTNGGDGTMDGHRRVQSIRVEAGPPQVLHQLRHRFRSLRTTHGFHQLVRSPIARLLSG